MKFRCLWVVVLFAPSAAVQAKDGHGAPAAASASVNRYNPPSRTYYRYKAPGTSSPWAPVKPAKSASGSVNDSYRRGANAAGRISPQYQAQADQYRAQAGQRLTDGKARAKSAISK